MPGPNLCALRYTLTCDGWMEDETFNVQSALT